MSTHPRIVNTGPFFLAFIRKKSSIGIGSLFALAGVIVVVLSGCQKSQQVLPEGTQAFFCRESTGQELTTAFFKLLQATGSPTGVVGTTAEQDQASRALVAPFLDPAFQCQHANGKLYVASDYMPSDIDQFEIRDLKSTQPVAGVLVTRYHVSVPGATQPGGNLFMSDQLKPRLTVFHWDDKAKLWKILTHANFNTPVDATLHPDPVTPPSPHVVSTPTEDLALGKKVHENFVQAAWAGQAALWMHPQAQIQWASGAGSTGLENYVPSKAVRPGALSDILVTRNGPLLVVSSWASVKGWVRPREGVMSPNSNPVLCCYLLSETGDWRLISVAAFRPPNALPQKASGFR